MQAESRFKSWLKRRPSRRAFLAGAIGLGTVGSLAAATSAAWPLSPVAGTSPSRAQPEAAHGLAHGHASTVGIGRGLPPEAPPPGVGARSPMEVLAAFDYGRVSQLPSGQTLREYTIVAQETEIEVAPGVIYPAWTYNGTVPGPSIRCTEGDRLKIYFHNDSPHPHSIHLHGIHPAEMDGVFEQVPPGGSYVYDFEAEPFGLFTYHCHTMPVKKHIEKGLYGAFIVDPPSPRSAAKEMVMVMNGFDTDVDGENEFYAVNTVANYFVKNPIDLRVGELARVYLVNMLEFDLINSFHLHGNVFKLFRTGTNLTHYELTDTVTMGQGERSILEFAFKYPGKYMFHAHQSEFSELGWMGFFDVKV